VAVARTLPGAPSARVVLPAPMLGALLASLAQVEPCPRMAEQEAWADRQGQQVKAERPHKLEAHKGAAEPPWPLAPVEFRARGETPRRVAARATRLAGRVEPRRRALARVAVAAPSGESELNGTNCCSLLSRQWDSWRDGGSVPAVLRISEVRIVRGRSGVGRRRLGRPGSRSFATLPDLLRFSSRAARQPPSTSARRRAATVTGRRF